MKQSARFVEIVGLAGAGKTTVSDLLYQQSPRVMPGGRLTLNSVENMLYAIWHLFLLFPIFFYQRKTGRQFTREEMKKMVYLNGWDKRRLQQQNDMGRNRSGAQCEEPVLILLDQGPLFNLATLYGFCPAMHTNPKFIQWWHAMLTKWSTVLDTVIWTTAPKALLFERIQTREKQHLVKGHSEHDAYRFFTCYEDAYDYILSQLTANENVQVIQVDSATQSADEIARHVVSRIHVDSTSGVPQSWGHMDSKFV